MDERRMQCPECKELVALDARGRLGWHLPPGPPRYAKGGRIDGCPGSRRPMIEVEPRGPVGGSPAWRPGDKKGGRR